MKEASCITCKIFSLHEVSVWKCLVDVIVIPLCMHGFQIAVFKNYESTINEEIIGTLKLIITLSLFIMNSITIVNYKREHYNNLFRDNYKFCIEQLPVFFFKLRHWNFLWNLCDLFLLYCKDPVGVFTHCHCCTAQYFNNNKFFLWNFYFYVI